MSAIKPGMLCRIVCNHQPRHRDRVVTAVQRVELDGPRSGWLVNADWLTGMLEAYRRMDDSCLQPISDPDVDLIVETDALHDNLLDALTMTRAG